MQELTVNDVVKADNGGGASLVWVRVLEQAWQADGLHVVCQHIKLSLTHNSINSFPSCKRLSNHSIINRIGWAPQQQLVVIIDQNEILSNSQEFIRKNKLFSQLLELKCVWFKWISLNRYMTLIFHAFCLLHMCETKNSIRKTVKMKNKSVYVKLKTLIGTGIVYEIKFACNDHFKGLSIFSF